MGVLGQLGNQEEPQQHFRKGLFPRGTISIAMKSRVRRESHARFCERLVVKSLRPTRPFCISIVAETALTRFSACFVRIRSWSSAGICTSGRHLRAVFQEHCALPGTALRSLTRQRRGLTFPLSGSSLNNGN